MPNLGSPTFGSDMASNASPLVASKEPPPQDGWRPGGPPLTASAPSPHAPPGPAEPSLHALRGELDRIDDAMHDLLIQRATVVERVARTGKPAAFRPGREAAIVRRLVARHHGALPAASLFRIWRELLAGTTAMQGGLSLAVCDADPGAALTQLAREHFGALTPLHQYGSPVQALADVSNGRVSVAVLPYPSDSATWWSALLHHEPRLYIISRLPFWRQRPDGAPSLQALVVAAAPPDASGGDRSLLGLECGSDVSQTRLADEMAASGLVPETMLLLHEPGLLPRESGSVTTYVLAEVEGYLTDDDPRLSRLRGVLRRPVVLGSYAIPFADSIG